MLKKNHIIWIAVDVIVQIVLIGLFLLFMWEQDKACEDRKTTCIVEILDDQCYSRYTEDTTRIKCQYDGGECFDKLNNTIIDCYLDHDTGTKNCPHFECLMIGFLLGMVFTAVAGGLLLLTNLLFTILIIYECIKKMFDGRRENNHNLVV